ncbi:uncharacterized protein LOC119104700 [Pollicipes pollicipes]|uniref:uncharacterized protein LOC119104700 n=1 Tax=Pollicipes pollicipes TaxID=41117 RepID=UPI0018852610|nr:uncharacterized protein LOC119104700 [Pollicipes pollicipes]
MVSCKCLPVFALPPQCKCPAAFALPSAVWQARRVERYRGQPGRIENYTPGKSSLAEQEAAKYWEEVMGYFDKFLEDHSHIKLERPLRGVRSRFGRLRIRLDAGIPPERAACADIWRAALVLPPDPARRRRAFDGPKEAGPGTAQSGGSAVPGGGRQYPLPVTGALGGKGATLGSGAASGVRRTPCDASIRRRAARRSSARSKTGRAGDTGDNFIPSQKSPIPLDRYERLYDDVIDNQRLAVTASVLHEFRAQNNRELSLSRGDTVRVRRKIDANWYEGQKGTRIGIFPVTYVQVNDPRARSTERWTPRPQVRARHRFTAQTSMELSLNKGDVVTVLRRVDDNWYEGRRGDVTGIFPISYVEPLGNEPREPSVQRLKPVGAPAAHGLVMDGMPTRGGGQGQLRVEVQQEPLTYRVLFPYDHQNEDELDLEEGDLIHVLEQCPDGWYVGTNLRTGMFGTFPGNYTQKM